MKLEKIYFGKTDAKNELIENSEAEKDRFLDGYLVPDGFNIKAFLSAEKYLVAGAKGTGKTALLRYLALNRAKDGTQISFVLFKSEITAEDRKDFSHAARPEMINVEMESYGDTDCEIIWRWFIHRHLVKCIENKAPFLFQDDSASAQYVKYIKSAYASSDGGFERLLPKIKKGYIEFSKSSSGGGIFNPPDPDAIALVKFNDAVKQADYLLEALRPGGQRLAIFFDELELTVGNQKQYARDSILIRDLIVTIEKFNNKMRQRGYGVSVYSAIRSEVITAIHASGKEINKPLSDFGAKILWNSTDVDPIKNPLIQILIKRIRSAEKETQGEMTAERSVLPKYFSERIHDKFVTNHILDNTWRRPRDIVRMFNIIQARFPLEEVVTQRSFDSTKRQYSQESWVEISEELTAHYSAAEIGAISRLFTAYQKRFTFSAIGVRCRQTMQFSPDAKRFFGRKELADVLSDCYKIGLILNLVSVRSGYQLRAAFQGDDELLLEHDMIIHPALHPYFGV